MSKTRTRLSLQLQHFYKYFTLNPASFFKPSKASSPVINVAFFAAANAAAKASAKVGLQI